MNSISNSSVIKDSIPKNIIQTYSHKQKIPEKVFLNIAKFAPDYKHLVFDDDDCIEFLRSNYSEHYVSIFNSYPRGAHKSDFFRYSYLYLKGGFYLDIKIELIKNLDEIIKDDTILYTVLSFNKNSIFQGILFCPPKFPVIKKALDNMVDTYTKRKNYQYNYFTIVLYTVIQEDVERETLVPGFNQGKENSYFLFKEECDKNPIHCYDGLDRHGLCCFSYDDTQTKSFKNRYADFGRRW